MITCTPINTGGFVVLLDFLNAQSLACVYLSHFVILKPKDLQKKDTSCLQKAVPCCYCLSKTLAFYSY